MSETATQALIRLVVTFLVTGLTALAANLTLLNDVISDKTLATLTIAVGAALIQAVLKYLGGATHQDAPVVAGGPRGANPAGAHNAKRPNPFAV